MQRGSQQVNSHDASIQRRLNRVTEQVGTLLCKTCLETRRLKPSLAASFLGTFAVLAFMFVPAFCLSMLVHQMPMHPSIMMQKNNMTLQNVCLFMHWHRQNCAKQSQLALSAAKAIRAAS